MIVLQLSEAFRGRGFVFRDSCGFEQNGIVANPPDVVVRRTQQK